MKSRIQMKSIISILLLLFAGKSTSTEYLKMKSISTFLEANEKTYDIRITDKHEMNCKNEEYVNLNEMDLRMIKNDIIQSDAIRHVSLYNNFLKKIPHNILDHVMRLSCMNLSRNSLNLYEANRIVHSNLLILDLSYQEISDINSIPEVETFGQPQYMYKHMIFNSSKIRLSNLIYLDLSGNDLSSLLWTFNLSFPKLIRLDLNNINAEELESSFFNKISTSVRVLHLENNYFRNLTIRNVGEVTALYLDNNIFETLYINSTKLRTLSLCNCTSRLSKGFFDTPYLEELNLSKNNFINLFDIDHLFGMFQSLKVLLLDYNKLTYFPTLTNLPRLNQLALRYNKIKYFKANSFKYLTSLTKLSLRGNNIENVEKETFSNLEKLQYLDLSENKLSHLSTDWALPLINLQSLSINSNQFADITDMGVYSIKTLQHLFIRNNTFKKITTLEIDPLPDFITIYL